MQKVRKPWIMTQKAGNPWEQTHTNRKKVDTFRSDTF